MVFRSSFRLYLDGDLAWSSAQLFFSRELRGARLVI